MSSPSGTLAGTLAGTASGTAAGLAFAGLPAVSQAVLWQVHVDRRSATEVARRLGLTPATVTELDAQARTSLRRGLVEHTTDSRGPACEAARTGLPAYVAARLGKAEATRVTAHLACCRGCSALYFTLIEAHTDLPRLLTSAVPGARAARLSGWESARPEPVRAVPTARPPRALATGLVACGLALGALGLLVGGTGGSRPYAAPVLAPDTSTVARPASPATAQVAARPTRAPTSTSTPRPTSAPVSTPTLTPGPTPMPTSTQTATPTAATSSAPVVPVVATPSPPAEPVTVVASANRSGLGLTSVVTVEVDGLADRRGAVTISGDPLVASLQLDPRCSLLGLGSATCALPGDGTLSLIALTLPSVPTTLTITAAPEGQPVDASHAGSTTSITLGGRV